MVTNTEVKLKFSLIIHKLSVLKEGLVCISFERRGNLDKDSHHNEIDELINDIIKRI